MSLLQTFDCTCGHVVESILVVKVFNPDHRTVLLSYIPVKLECPSEAIRCQPLLHPFSILRNAPLSFLRIIALDKCFSTVPIRRTNQGLFTLDTSLLYNALKPAKCFPSAQVACTERHQRGKHLLPAILSLDTPLKSANHCTHADYSALIE